MVSGAFRILFWDTCPLRIKAFTGGAYEIGFQRGRELGDLPMPGVSPPEVAFALACRGCVEALYPPILEMFEGMLAGGGFDRDRFTVYFFARKQGVLRGCTNFAALPSITRDGAVIVGRNYDWVYSDLKWCELRYLHVEGALPVLSYTHHWAGHPDCLNTEGLYIVISSLPGQEPQAPGVQWNLLVDTLTATCCRVDEAERILRSVYHLRSIAYLIVDAEGGAIVAEAGPGHVRIRRPENGALIATNHMLGEEDASARSRYSRLRYTRVEEVLRARSGHVDEAVAKEILSDHNCTICCGVHGAQSASPHRDEDWGTLWSSVCRPDLPGLQIAPGHPCEVAYEPVTFEASEAAAEQQASSFISHAKRNTSDSFCNSGGSNFISH